MEGKKNVERRKANLTKLNNKISALKDTQMQNESKMERLEDEFATINKTFDSPFHQFKHCNVSLNPQIANQMFE